MDARSQPDPPLQTDERSAAAARGRRRRGLLTILAGALVVLGIVFALYWLLVGAHHVSTNDAYVQADTAEVTPLVAGPVIAAPVSDTFRVRQGDVLLVIDPADFRLAVAQDEAALGQAQRKVQGYFADADAQAATTNARLADVDRAVAQLSSAQADYTRAQTDLTRRQALAPAGAVSGDELTAAQNRFDQTRDAVAAARAAVAQAQASRLAARAQATGAEALVAGADLNANPEVAAAPAKPPPARNHPPRTVVRAPVAGVVAKNAVEVGQRVQAGASLMTIVPIQSVYVNANFKENQLRKMRLGQPVTLTSDLWGGGVKFHGRVAGFPGGSGSAFAVIPAQNATGNWIKVVQRLPVRIDLDPRELARHPLSVGLSMNVDVDTAR